MEAADRFLRECSVCTLFLWAVTGGRNEQIQTEDKPAYKNQALEVTSAYNTYWLLIGWWRYFVAPRLKKMELKLKLTLLLSVTKSVDNTCIAKD